MPKIGEIFVEISANNQKLRGGLAQASSLIRDWSLVVTGLTQGITNAFRMIATVGIKAVTISLAVLSTAFAITAKSGAEFQDNIIRAFVIMRESSGATAQSLKKLTDEAIRLGSETLFSATQAAIGLQTLARAGFTTEQAITAIGPVLDLAIVGNIELAESSNIAVASMFGFGLEASDMTKVVDVLSLASSQANTTISLLGSALAFVAPVALSAGLSIEETASAIGVLSNAGIRGCYDEETEVLTIDGYKYWRDVTMEDTFATINPETHNIEYQKPIALVNEPYKGKMYVVKNKHINLKVTPNHWMYVKKRGKYNFERVRADEIYGKDSEYLVTGNWEGNKAEYITLPGFEQNRGSYNKTIKDLNIKTEDFVEFLGWYISEGNCDCYNGNYRICITQNKDRYFKDIQKCLDKLPFNYNIIKSKDNSYKFVITNQQLYNYVKPLGKSYEKYIPKEIKALDKKYLLVFYESFCKGDGDKEGRLYTSSVKLRDDLEEILLKSGYGVKHFLKMKTGTVNVIKGRKVIAKHGNWLINVNKKQLTPSFYNSEYNSPKHKERLKVLGNNIVEKWEYYDGRMYCAEVPNHLLIVRREGKSIVCGNSRAGTTLRRAFSILLAPTGRAKKIFDELGMSFNTAEGGLISFTEIIAKLNKANLTAAQTQTIFGRIAGPGMAALLRQGSEALNVLTAKLEGAEGAADRMSQAFRTTVKGRVRDLGASIINLGLAFSEKFNGPLADTIFGIRNFVKDITEALQRTGIFNSVVEGSIAALSPLTSKIKMAAAEFKNFLLNLTPETVADFFNIVKNNIEEFIKKLKENLDAIVAFFKGISIIFEKLFGFIIKLGKAFDGFGDNTKKIVAFILGLVSTITVLAGGLVPLIAGFVIFNFLITKNIQKIALASAANLTNATTMEVLRGKTIQTAAATGTLGLALQGLAISLLKVSLIGAGLVSVFLLATAAGRGLFKVLETKNIGSFSEGFTEGVDMIKSIFKSLPNLFGNSIDEMKTEVDTAKIFESLPQQLKDAMKEATSDKITKDFRETFKGVTFRGEGGAARLADIKARFGDGKTPKLSEAAKKARDISRGIDTPAGKANAAFQEARKNLSGVARLTKFIELEEQFNMTANEAEAAARFLKQARQPRNSFLNRDTSTSIMGGMGIFPLDNFIGPKEKQSRATNPELLDRSFKDIFSTPEKEKGADGISIREANLISLRDSTAQLVEDVKAANQAEAEREASLLSEINDKINKVREAVKHSQLDTGVNDDATGSDSLPGNPGT